MMAYLSKAAMPFVIASAMLLAAAGLHYAALATARGMVDDVRTLTIAERDAHWSGEIERSNATANRQVADQARATLQIQAAAADKVRQAELALSEMEKANAALPNGDACGLDRDRVRLLAR
ncbi:hypothetical protein DEM27_32590 [Metarhizobium album]|uniref:Uncharacterized protein n=1 Tax=Metarhizobium album TaxID=2182425 RepID=A0A2U2DFS1_9HYPH|nr:hypothetical protein [Rhizobium album]PWE52140.1 hypothetical protein DEM27_32590 [Rhizobium album]